MFETIIPTILKPKTVEWDTPKYLKIDTGDNYNKTYEILKGAENFLYSELDIKSSTMKDVFKKAPDIWKQLKDYRLKIAEDDPDITFNFVKPTVAYLSNSSNEIIDIVDFKNEDKFKEFLENLENYNLNITTITKTRKFYSEGKNIIKLICYDKDIELPKVSKAPVVVIEYNITKSIYSVYTGILIYNDFTLIPSMNVYYETDKLSTLINQFNFEDALDYATQKASILYENYEKFKQNPVEISARELITLLKKVGYKLELKTDDDLDKIKNINDETSNAKIQDFFNTFRLKTAESAYDILNLTELKKMFRYNKLTLLDVLSILSKEYLNYEGAKITMDILSTLVHNILSKQIDRNDIDIILTEAQDYE